MKKKETIRLLFLTMLLMAFVIGSASCSVHSETLVSEPSVRLNVAAGADDPIVNYGSAVNIIIFICFADENPNTIRSTIPTDFRDRCNGSDNSIKDYYNDLSYGQFTFNSLFPTYNDGTFFIYRDSKSRSYYTGNTASSGKNRTRPESDLLNNAVYEASLYLDLSGSVLDMNEDGYVDCVTFLISGDYKNENWNKIMWPHSWQLDNITKEAYSTSSASLGGKRVNDYTFLFLDTVSSRLGLMCHELGHAVGNLPDLYHYNSSESKYLPVGYWDLMHLDCATPQFMTTYLRWKYLSFVNDNQIVEMEKSGDYTLTPTTVTGPNETLAYKLTIDNGTNSPNESIWIEYRRTDVSTYDRDLPGSGLVVYRINTKADEGNKNARHENTSYPDEVYFYRPNFSTKSSVSEREKENLSGAYLSERNSRFSSLGDSSSTSKYDPSCIFLTDGKNTGIVITIVSESAEQVTFHIELGQYDSSEIDYNASYVMGNTGNKKEVVVYYGEDIKSQINLYVKRRNRGIYRAEDADITLLGGESLYEVCEDGKDAYLEYTDDYGTHRFSYRLTVYDKLESYSAVILNLPTKRSYTVGEQLSLNGLILQAEYASGKKTIVYSPEGQSTWDVVGFDSQKSGEQDITVVYNGDVRVHFTVNVYSDLISLRIDEKNTRHIRGETIAPHFHVIACYKDGTERTLGEDEFTAYFGTERDYMRTEVTIRAKDDESIDCTTYSYKIPHRMTAITLVSDPKNKYNYGEALDLSAGKIQVSFGEFSLDGDNALPLENYYSYFYGYLPTYAGKQSLRLAIEDATLVMDVEVYPLPGALLSIRSDDVRLNENAAVLLLDKEYTLGELYGKLGSYLSVTFRYKVGDDTFTVLPETYGSLLLQSCIKIVLTNSEGVEIKTYSVYRSGDGNDDGKMDEEDVIYWKRSIINKDESSKATLFDRNGDNKYTLTDYILLTDELRKEAK